MPHHRKAPNRSGNGYISIGILPVLPGRLKDLDDIQHFGKERKNKIEA